MGEKPAPQRNQMQFQYIEKPTESEKKPKTGNDKEAEHVKKYLKRGVSHFLNTFMCRDYKISI